MNIVSETIDSVTEREALAINGKSWPHTERIGLTVGDTARWRVVNGTVRGHPMHLHGFYFRVDATGNGISSRDIPDSLQRARRDRGHGIPGAPGRSPGRRTARATGCSTVT